MNYLTGYDGWSFYTRQILALSHDAGPVWIGRAWDIACVRQTTDLPAADVEGYEDGYVQATDRHEFDMIAGVLARRGWGAKRLGVEMDTYYYTARCHERLAANLPDARFVDATSLVNWVRIVKSPQELAYMAQAGRIADLSVRPWPPSRRGSGRATRPPGWWRRRSPGPRSSAATCRRRS
jgi:Xaa-Pro aminopeptidase